MGLFVMKLYLDDQRSTPDGWERAYHVWEVIEKLQTGKVSMLSLDHDLGSGEPTGYEVLTWIENEVFTNPSYVPPTILIHTANPTAKDRMMAARYAIFREVSRRAESNSTEGQR
jgi:hypothetical protein